MKQLLFGFLLLATFQNMNSQVVFCPPGAQWTNIFNLYLPFEPIVTKITYIGDSTLGGETFKVLRHNQFFTLVCDPTYSLPFKPHTLIKQRGDTIFMRNPYTQHTWQILYNFAALPGDMWVNVLGGPPTLSYYTTFVDSISTVTINNFLLKQLHVTVNYCGTGFNAIYHQTNSTITERIGFGGHLFPYFIYPSGNCEWSDFAGPLCYGDNAFGVRQFSTNGCYFTGMQENDSHPFDVTLFPNPVLSELHLKCDFALHDENTYACFCDLHGREIKRITLTPEMNTINFRDVSNGMYIVTIIRNRQVVYKTKIVKEQ